MEPKGYRSKPEMIAAAVAIVDEQGFPGREFISATTAGRLAGVHRATIHRHWPTALELNADLLTYATTLHPDWQRIVVDADPALGLSAALRQAVNTPMGVLGVVFRCGAEQARAMYATAPEAPVIEQRWLRSFERWLIQHLDHHGRRLRNDRTLGDLALALAAMIEGGFLVAVLTSGLDPSGWPPRTVEGMLTAADLIVRDATLPVDPADPPAVPAPLDLSLRLDLGGAPASPAPWTTWTATKRALLAKVFDGGVREHVVESRAVPAMRMVAPEALAERLGITERWVYASWPSTAEFNGDIIEAIVSRFHETVTAALAEAVSLCIDQPPKEHPAIIETMLLTSIGAARADGGQTFVDCVFAAREPVMYLRSAAVYRAWITRHQRFVLALLHATERDAVPGLSSLDVVQLGIGALIGSARMYVVGVPDASEPESLRRCVQALGLLWMSLTQPTAVRGA